MFIRTILSLSLLIGSAHSIASEKQALAMEVFDKVVLPQAEPIVNRMLAALVREKQAPDAVVNIYRETLLEVLRHPNYRQAYVAAYVRLFTEQELSGLIELSRNPSFIAFARESTNITQLTYPTFLDLNSKAKLQLEKRLSEKGLSEWK